MSDDPGPDDRDSSSEQGAGGTGGVSNSGLVSLMTAYGHQVTIAPRPGGGVCLCIAASRIVDGYDVHLAQGQATTIAAALGMLGRLPDFVTDQPAPGTTDRGFLSYDAAGYPQASNGVRIRVQESSAASGPHVWLFQVAADGKPNMAGSPQLELDQDNTLLLRDALGTHLALIDSRWGPT